MNKNHKSKKRIGIAPKLWLTAAFIMLLLFLFFDYINLPSIIGIKIKNININLFSSIINSVVVIVLYIISYYAIDKYQQRRADDAEKRELQKGENIKAIGDLLLNNTYRECLEIIEIIDDEIIGKQILPMVYSYSKNEGPDGLIEKQMLTGPFENFNQIISFAESGHLSKERINEYLDIKERFLSIAIKKISITGINTDNEDEEFKYYLESVNKEFKDLKKELESKVSYNK